VRLFFRVLFRDILLVTVPGCVIGKALNLAPKEFSKVKVKSGLDPSIDPSRTWRT